MEQLITKYFEAETTHTPPRIEAANGYARSDTPSTSQRKTGTERREQNSQSPRQPSSEMLNAQRGSVAHLLQRKANTVMQLKCLLLLPQVLFPRLCRFKGERKPLPYIPTHAAGRNEKTVLMDDDPNPVPPLPFDCSNCVAEERSACQRQGRLSTEG